MPTALTQPPNPELPAAAQAPVPLSPLQLTEYAFTKVRVAALSGGSPTAEPSLRPSLWFDRVPNTPDQWRLVLTLKLSSADPAKPFLYDADLRIQGTVTMKSDAIEDRKEQLALVNGFSLLYGAAREMLLTVSARSAHGAVCLPTLSFVELVADAKRQKAAAPSPPAPKDPAPGQPRRRRLRSGTRRG